MFNLRECANFIKTPYIKTVPFHNTNANFGSDEVRQWYWENQWWLSKCKRNKVNIKLSQFFIYNEGTLTLLIDDWDWLPVHSQDVYVQSQTATASCSGDSVIKAREPSRKALNLAVLSPLCSDEVRQDHGVLNETPKSSPPPAPPRHLKLPTEGWTKTMSRGIWKPQVALPGLWSEGGVEW